MRVLNKVLKLLVSYLRGQGLSSVEYVDDTLLESDIFLECKHNLITTFTFLEALDFFVHPNKSIFHSQPRHRIFGFPHKYIEGGHSSYFFFIFSSLRSETKGSRFELGCYLFVEVSSLQ